MATDFSGVWHSVYHYRSPSRPGLRDSVHEVEIHETGDRLVIESLPNKEGSYIILRLKLDGDKATGTWEEHTSPTGFYKGEIYFGAVQFILTEDGNMFHGISVGAERNNEVRSNYWEITRKNQSHAESDGAESEVQ